MRANSRNPLQKVLDLASRQTIEKLKKAGLLGHSARYGRSTPPSTVTTPGVGPGGEVVTERIFMLNVDALNEPGAKLSVQGNITDYGS